MEEKKAGESYKKRLDRRTIVGNRTIAYGNEELNMKQAGINRCITVFVNSECTWRQFSPNFLCYSHGQYFSCSYFTQMLMNTGP